MAVRLTTPKVDLSESILGPTKIPGLGDIQITHPDVTTDFDWPEMVSRRGGFHKTVASVNGHLKRWRRTIVLAYGRRLYLGQRRSATYLFVFNRKCCYSTTNNLSSYRISAVLTHTFVPSILLPLPTSQQRPQRGSIAAGNKRGLSPAFVWPTGKPTC